MLSPNVKNRILTKIGELVTTRAKRNCPVDNGQLKNSIYYRVEEDSVFVGSDIDYAWFQEYGTGVFHIDENGVSDPHSGWDVIPVNAKALRWTTGRGKGKLVHFAKKVHIEGMHAHPFLRPALHQSIPDFAKIIAKELSS